VKRKCVIRGGLMAIPGVGSMIQIEISVFGSFQLAKIKFNFNLVLLNSSMS